MATGSMLPPDIRAQMKDSAAPRRGGGIGAAAHENEASARAREVAMHSSKDEEDAPPAVDEPDADDLKTCPRCNTDLNSEWNFCAKCGADLIRGGAAKYLGISFDETDVHDYLFRGYIAREIPILGKFKATMKSSQPRDVDEIDAYIMTGSWRKLPDGKERVVSDFYLQQINTLCMTASAVQKINGESIGVTLKDRMEWLIERGSAVVDMLGQRAILFNRALTDYLKKADTVLGS